MIVVCNEGYQSSLAAATLRRLGVDGATDLIGGYQGLLAMWGESEPRGEPSYPSGSSLVSRSVRDDRASAVGLLHADSDHCSGDGGEGGDGPYCGGWRWQGRR